MTSFLYKNHSHTSCSSSMQNIIDFAEKKKDLYPNVTFLTFPGNKTNSQTYAKNVIDYGS